MPQSNESTFERLNAMIPCGAGGVVPRLIGLLLEDEKLCQARAFMRAPRIAVSITQKHEHILEISPYCNEDAESLEILNADKRFPRIDKLREVHADSGWTLRIHNPAAGIPSADQVVGVRDGIVVYSYDASNETRITEVALPTEPEITQDEAIGRLGRIDKYTKWTKQPVLVRLGARIAAGECKCNFHSQPNKHPLRIVAYLSRRPPSAEEDDPDWSMRRDLEPLLNRVDDSSTVEVSMSSQRPGKRISENLRALAEPPDVVVIVRGGEINEEWLKEFASDLQDVVSEFRSKRTRFYVGVGHSGRRLGERLPGIVEADVPALAARAAIEAELERPAAVAKQVAALRARLEIALATTPAYRLREVVDSAIDEYKAAIDQAKIT